MQKIERYAIKRVAKAIKALPRGAAEAISNVPVVIHPRNVQIEVTGLYKS